MTQAARNHAVPATEAVPAVQVGDLAPDFSIDTPGGAVPLRALARQVGTVVLVSQDSYRYHPR